VVAAGRRRPPLDQDTRRRNANHNLGCRGAEGQRARKNQTHQSLENHNILPSSIAGRTRRRFSARVRRSPKSEAGQEARPIGDKKRPHIAEQFAGIRQSPVSGHASQRMIRPVEFVCRAFPEVFDRFRTLANGDCGGMKAIGRLAAEVIHPLHYPRSFRIEQRR